MKRSAIHTPNAPAAVGAYSPAIHLQGSAELLFASGQIGLDPATGALVPGGVEAEAERAMTNLGAVLGSAGFGFENVVRATLYLTDMADFQRVNAIYAARFPGEEPPARVAIGVQALPKGAVFEVDAIAAK